MKTRFLSLDTFRGATVAFMILVNNPGSWQYMFSPLEHAKWHGCTPTDLVFPFFLFAVGNALAFVIPNLQTNDSYFFWKKVLKRTALIFLIGLLLNWSPFLYYKNDSLVVKTFTYLNSNNQWQGVRIMGVLQRIAICYGIAAIVAYYCKPKLVFVISSILLLSYWLLCILLGPPNNYYSLSGFFGTSIDLNILGSLHIYKGEGVPFDPEGLISTLPAIAQVLLGYLIGNFIKNSEKNYTTLAQILVWGIAFTAIGFIWNYSFPINKKIWSSSYVAYTTGLAIIGLGLMMYAIDIKQQQGKWSKFFDVFGKNALFIFVLSGLLPRFLSLIRIKNGIDEVGHQKYLSPLGWFYQNVCEPISTDLRIGSFAYSLFIITLYWGIAYILDKKKIYIKV